MKFVDMLQICFQDLTNKKSRTLLTIIGVIAGTCAILVMSSIGIGMKENQDKMLSEMGDLKEIQVYNYNDSKRIDDVVLRRWKQIPGVSMVSPVYSPDNLNIKIQAKNKRYEVPYVNVIGVYPEFLKEMGLEYLDEPVKDTGKKESSSFRLKKKVVAAVGEAFAYSFADVNRTGWNNQVIYEKDENGVPTKKPYVDLKKDRITFTLQIGEEDKKGTSLMKEFKVNGRLKENSRKIHQSYDGIIMDIGMVKEMEKLANPKLVKKKPKGYNQVILMVKSIDDAEQVEKAIKEDGYDTNSLVEMRKSLQKNRQQQMQMLYSTSLLAVFVAAVSIMNTMIMSVSERTKEIGVMKVLGCYISDIRRLFLLESGVIGFGGGMLGIGLSYGISFLLNRFGASLVPSGAGMEWMEGEAVAGAVSVLPPYVALAGLLFATLIGIFAGYLPANRAVKIPALEAMKA